MTPKLAPVRRALSILAGAAVIAVIFAMAALFGALVANATSPTPRTTLTFAGATYQSGCWVAFAFNDELRACD